METFSIPPPPPSVFLDKTCIEGFMAKVRDCSMLSLSNGEAKEKFVALTIKGSGTHTRSAVTIIIFFHPFLHFDMDFFLIWFFANMSKKQYHNI